MGLLLVLAPPEERWRELAQRFTVAAYAPREVAVEALAPALAVWEELRPVLLRRVRLRFHLA